MPRASRALLWFVLSAGPTGLAAQERSVLEEVQAARAEASELERRGAFAEAAAAYRQGLSLDPANATLLFGLERTLSRIGQVQDALPAVREAVVREPANELFRGLEFRIGARVGGPDSAAAIAARWMASVPTSVAPYREWARWLAQRGETDGALAVLGQGQTRFGPEALAADAAPVLALADRWEESAVQWGIAVTGRTGLLTPASGSLGRAPESARDEVLVGLLDNAGAEGQWLAADLLALWNRATEGWAVLASALPSGGDEAARLVARYAERARVIGTDDARLAEGYALERLAQLTAGPAADQARLEAAEAFADAGNLTAAQRMLSQISSGADAGGRSAAAMATFIRVLAESGQTRQAQDLFDDWQARLPATVSVDLRERLAWAWIDAGDLRRAENLVSSDSTIGAFAIQGWLALYRGDLRGATERLRAAGPFAQSRGMTTRSAEMLALLQRIQADELPELGRALLAAARGDTVGAIADLRRAAGAVPAAGGRADLLTLAGRWANQSGNAEAEALLLAALDSDAEGPAAPVAELELAMVYDGAGRHAEALARVEHLILTYPRSAVVPQARRLLDRLRGMVPRT